jgi:asparagine synthase (glutamine-hydrolysing)
MCGICGITYPDSRQTPSERDLLAMRELLVHRGPDDAGSYVAPGVALGSRRLAILDLSPRGRMPMSTPDGRFHIVYNGEIYNFRELRKDLESRGHVFHSDTDTEVVLRLYEEQGPAMLGRLNGMFAFAVWDQLDRRLFLARDRVGVKPLYYAEYRGAFYFASEQKALFAAGVPASFDQEVGEELLCFRYAAGDRTPFAGVKRLLPGHYLERHGRHNVVRRWWRLADRARELRETSPSDPQEWRWPSAGSAMSRWVSC